MDSSAYKDILPDLDKGCKNMFIWIIIIMIGLLVGGIFIGKYIY